ncbi:MAG: PilN domain-containing protein [Gammaproteobacteria bacterium]|nr:PilN domain-containing protein [Gammaproteobacteria bacterium]MDH4253910.1 PilN domain-containing protein [Gammaproteobacteria bacterium]MDH5310690.1 PilN domain-containing protein [Gammaproteobacteria bacterium]
MNVSLSLADLGRLKADGRQLLSRFWCWWTAEIVAAMPSWLMQFLGSGESRLVVAQQNDRLSMTLVRPDERRKIADFDRDTVTDADLADVRSAVDAVRLACRRIDLELPRGRVLQRKLRLPAGTEERLGQVLGFEMDRFTPFTRDQVYFDYRVSGRDAPSGTLSVDLTLTLRSYLDGLLKQLESCGIRPTAVRVAEKFAREAADSSRADLLPEAYRPDLRWRARALPLGLAAIALALLAATVALPVAHRAETLSELEAQVRAIEPDALAAAELRDEIASVSGQAAFFQARRSETPTTLQMLDELTRVVPDDTWVSRLELPSGQVRLHGESESASSLIALMEASTMLRNARFASPVTKNPRTGNDRFVIEAELLAPGGAAP